MKQSGAKRDTKGFTLIELLMVVAIIGILSAIALPKFADLVKKAKEGKSKGNMSTVRSAINIYYGDSDGIFPFDDLASLTANQKYIKEVPALVIPIFAEEGNPGHGETQTVSAQTTFSSAADTGQWGYVNNTTDANWGHFWVLCSHNDSKSVAWNTR
ncbi:MAG: type II secretion system protein [Elusimicrobiota bacterium]